MHSALESKLSAVGLVVSEPAPAVDVNGFYVMRSTAADLDLTTVSDLKKVGRKLTFGGPPECLERPLCLGDSSQKLYGLQFAKVLQLDTGGHPKRVPCSSRGASMSACFSPAAA